MSQAEMFARLAHSRYSCRGFSDRAVSREDLERVIHAAIAAPSACNMQPVHFYAVTDRSREDIFSLRNWYNSSSIVFVCTDARRAWRRGDGTNYADTDAGIACAHMLLQAEALGINSCVIASFDPDAVSEALMLDSGEKPLLAVCLGYRAEHDAPSSKHNLRKAPAQICTFV